MHPGSVDACRPALAFEAIAEAPPEPSLAMLTPSGVSPDRKSDVGISILPATCAADPLGPARRGAIDAAAVRRAVCGPSLEALATCPR